MPKDNQRTIIVNGREKEVGEKELSFSEVVALAFGHPPEGGTICYTVTFKRGRGEKPEGLLAEGENMKIKDGMIVNVSRTDKS